MTKWCHLWLSVLMLLGTCLSCIRPSIAQSAMLAIGTAIERELTGGQSHVYSLTLEAKQYVRGVVEQRGIDVVVSLVSPDGKTLLEVDSPNGTQGAEAFASVTTQAGVYQIIVRSPEKKAATARYEIKLEEVRAATREDELRVAANLAFQQADRLLDEQKAEASTAAIAKFQELLPIWEDLKDRKMQARTLHNLGYAARQLSDLPQALRYNEQALQVRRSLGDRSGEGDSLLALATTLASLGRIDEALAHYTQALPVYQDLGDRVYEARVLANIGRVLLYNNQNQKALEYLQQALPLSRAAHAPDVESYALEALGHAFYALGEDEQAVAHYDLALSLARAQKRRDIETRLLVGKGIVLYRNARQTEGLALVKQGWALCRERGNRFEEVPILRALARMNTEMGAPQQGIELAQQALALTQQLEDRIGEAGTRLELGISYDALNEEARALENFQTAVTLSRVVRMPFVEAEGLYHLARLAQKQGKLPEARAQSDALLTILETLRTSVVSQDLRTSLFARLQRYYDFHIQLLQELEQQHPNGDYAAAALYTSERARGRGLLESLNESRHDIRAGVAAELLQRERTLRQQLNDRADKQSRLLSNKRTEAQAAAVDKELSELARQLQEVEAQIRASSPRYASLTQPQPLTAKEIQQQLLDDDTLLLEYALGEKQSYLWVVSPTEIKSFTLPARKEITTAARKVYEGLNVAPTASTNPKLEAEAKALSQILLGAAAAQLANKRLLIVAPEMLAYLPFAALPDPAQANQPLIVNHEIVNLPSASVLAVLRRENANRQRTPKTVAVLADPIFEADDPRVALAKGAKTKGAKPTTANEIAVNTTATEFSRAVRSMNRATLGRLAFSREEAEAIVAFTNPAQGLKALSFEANRATAMSDKLSQYRIVHFATHGLLNSTQPELSGLVFSLLDERGEPQDGFVRLHEIYNLKLPADLVVLSACQTGLGKEIKGEGLIGLTRGFMYAGAPRVVASLWRVNDYATAELMKRFYKGMLKDNLRPAAALRAAQIEMWKQKRFAVPYYWAAFTLQGEWK